MMTKKHSLLVAVIAFVMGCMAGIYGTSIFLAKQFTDYIIGANLLEAQHTVRALETLRRDNNGEAADLLEMKLDSALISLGAYIDTPQFPQFLQNPQYVRTVHIAKDYRSRFPRITTTPEIDTSVTRVFQSTGKRTSH